MPLVDPGDLAAHLAAVYGSHVASIAALDVNVFRVDREGGPAWVARVFPEQRELAGVLGDAAILHRLEQAHFPAERCAHPEAVSNLDGCGVLVTEYLAPAAPLAPGRVFAILGTLLGRLHAAPITRMRDGGAWHHLRGSGTPRDEVDAARELVERVAADAGPADLPLYHRLLQEIEATDDCQDLPHAFVHPDFVPANAIPTPQGGLVIVDWANAGRGPRLWSLGMLLWAAGALSPRLIDVVGSRYARHIQLEPEELDRLPAAIRARPVMLEAWAACNGRRTPRAALARIASTNHAASSIAERFAVAAHT